MSDETKELSLRIERIETLLDNMVAERAPVATELTVDEIKAFQKVRDVIAADWGNMCGINDCFRCIVVRCSTVCQVLCDVVCQPCDVECSCGPCSVGGLRGRVSRFSRMGG
ncbi:hypothetical protein [Roseibium sp. Sym1]|uniref:hypothetical protein n=1 Tax=Roseibium sp. Sym1 TaxID=3016006 RepID=UPI0022B3A662|nr:hypothetical protein [Roseibium sp. Sym1]